MAFVTVVLNVLLLHPSDTVASDKLAHEQQVATLPMDKEWSPAVLQVDSATSELAIDSSGRMLFAGNRHQQGHPAVKQSLACFTLNSVTGELTAEESGEFGTHLTFLLVATIISRCWQQFWFTQLNQSPWTQLVHSSMHVAWQRTRARSQF
eukprot:SAG31_NODE_3299_length_4445_cov_3.190520_2_plen_151_part_00